MHEKSIIITPTLIWVAVTPRPSDVSCGTLVGAGPPAATLVGRVDCVAGGALF
jgi:hypothetical protein